VRGANPCGALLSVEPMMTSREMKVITASQTRQANNACPPGECAPCPFAAKPAAAEKWRG